MIHTFEPGEKVIVIMRQHTYRDKKEKPPLEIEGTFVKYNTEERLGALVDIITKAEGRRRQSFIIDRIRPKGTA